MLKLFFFLLLVVIIGCQPTTTSSSTIESTDVVKVDSKGKTLFLENCASCHNISMIHDMTGPALKGVTTKWENRTELIQFIQEPQLLINNNHPRAKAVAELWPSEMLAFPQLDSVAIEAILEFIES